MISAFSIHRYKRPVLCSAPCNYSSPLWYGWFCQKGQTVTTRLQKEAAQVNPAHLAAPSGMDRIVFHNYRSWMHTLFACICLRVPHILDGPPLGVQLIKEFLMLMSIDVSSYCGRALSSGFRTITRRWIKGSSIVALSWCGVQHQVHAGAWGVRWSRLVGPQCNHYKCWKVLKVKDEIRRASGTHYLRIPTYLHPSTIHPYVRTCVHTYMHACIVIHPWSSIHHIHGWMIMDAYAHTSIHIYMEANCILFVWIWKMLISHCVFTVFYAFLWKCSISLDVCPRRKMINLHLPWMAKHVCNILTF